MILVSEADLEMPVVTRSFKFMGIPHHEGSGQRSPQQYQGVSATDSENFSNGVL